MRDKDHTPTKTHDSLPSRKPWSKLTRWSVLVVTFIVLLSAVTTAQNPIAQTPANARAKQIISLFNGPDGTHLNLSIIVQAGLNNPDSFQHQQTTFKDMGEYLVVNMTYHARTESGEMVSKRTRAKVDLTGKVISILENR